MTGYDFAAIKQRYPLSEIAARSVKLRRSGKEYEGLCPFHHEKTPSFYVNDDKGFYHCFGCSAHGDVIDFVQKIDGLGTPQEAIARLTGGESVTFTPAQRQARQEWLDARDQEESEARKAAIKGARRRWDQGRPVDGSNDYLDRKQIAPFMTRTEGANLLVPMWDAEGDLINVQSIPAEVGQKKLYQKGCPTVGARHYIGIAFGKTIICEGFATGASIFEGTGDRVCVAFSSGQLPNIARELAREGVPIVIAADRGALAEMERLGQELGVPVIAPPPSLKTGDDFNDLMIESGVEAVATAFRQGLIDYQNKPSLPPEPPDCAIAFVDAMDFLEQKIPLRPWIVPGALLSGATHILAAPGGTGKSVFTLQFALMLASGMKWAGWQPKKKCRVLVINAEDDIDEQRRRLAGAVTVMAPDHAELRGQIMLADNPASILVSTTDPIRKSQVATPLVDELVAVVRHHKIDVIVVDPFAETFDGDENSNGDTKWAMRIWRDQIARATGAAVYLVHHTTKGSEDKAGSADVIRGGGAIVNSARMASTLFVMSKGEAEALGVREDDRFRYVRYDSAKSNNSLIGGRNWFEKMSVTLRNGPAGDSEGGDEVGALMPWHPEGLAAYDPEAIMRLLAAINDGYVDEDGIATEQPFGRTSVGNSKRWVGYLIGDMMGVETDEARKIVKLLMDAGIVTEQECDDPLKGRRIKGLKADMEAAAKALGALPQ